MPFIGLTGGFGTGKTTVLKLFKYFGAYTINADRLVHEILKKPAIIKKLSAILGRDILLKRAGKNFINKKLMADIIFNEPKKRILVEKIIHPKVIKTAMRMKTIISKENPRAVIVFEVPLLFEGGYKNIFDKTIVVYCSKARAIEHLKKIGFSKEEALRRMRAQMPITTKKAYADFIINNNFNIISTTSQIKMIFKVLEQL